MRLDRFAALRLCFGAMCLGMLFGCGGDSAPPGGNSSPKIDLGDASAAATGNLKRIIVLTNGNAPFWDAGAAGAR